MPIAMRMDACFSGIPAIIEFFTNYQQAEQEMYLKVAAELYQLELNLVSGQHDFMGENDLSRRDAVYAAYCQKHAKDEFVLELIRTPNAEIPAVIKTYTMKRYSERYNQLLQYIEEAVGTVDGLQGLQLCKDGLLTGIVEGSKGRCLITTSFNRDQLHPYKVEITKI